MITVITVTYGNRWEYLCRVLESIHASELISRIVIYNNGSDYDVNSRVQKRFRNITVLDCEMNDGSAAGFKRALEFVCKSSAEEWILLLDDDNVIDHDSLKKLMDSWNSLKIENELYAVVALREARNYLKEASLGGNVKYLFPLGNDCFGFDIEIAVQKIIYNLITRRKIFRQNSVHEIVKLPMAPYGGLFFQKRILEIIGFPDERYFAYADDYEFTYRIYSHGGAIYLVSSALVKDIDAGWVNQSKKRLISSKYLEQSDYRAYLSIRNKIYFSIQQLVTSDLLFSINLFLFQSYLFIIALLSGKFAKYKLIQRAIKQGVSGDLSNDMMKSGAIT